MYCVEFWRYRYNENEAILVREDKKVKNKQHTNKGERTNEHDDDTSSGKRIHETFDHVKSQVTGGFEAVEASVKKTALSAKDKFRKAFANKNGELGFFEPKTWAFWRALIVCFCIMNLLGHLLEIPYCLVMDTFFGIVDESYAVWTDPWYHPYWVYGAGAVVMTILLEPIKERIIVKRKTLWGALLESFVIVVILAAAMECIIGWMVNQPDPVTGMYPFWDNSHLPGNIFGQAWIVNDIAIGIGAMIYVWLVYPLVCRFLNRIKQPISNGIFVFIVIGFIGCCIASYGQLFMSGAISL